MFLIQVVIVAGCLLTLTRWYRKREVKKRSVGSAPQHVVPGMNPLSRPAQSVVLAEEREDGELSPVLSPRPERLEAQASVPTVPGPMPSMTSTSAPNPFPPTLWEPAMGSWRTASRIIWRHRAETRPRRRFPLRWGLVGLAGVVVAMIIWRFGPLVPPLFPPLFDRLRPLAASVQQWVGVPQPKRDGGTAGKVIVLDGAGFEVLRPPPLGEVTESLREQHDPQSGLQMTGDLNAGQKLPDAPAIEAGEMSELKRVDQGASDLEDLQADLKAVVAERDRLQVERDRLQAALDTAQAQEGQLQAEYDASLSNLKQMQQKFDQAEAQLAQLRALDAAETPPLDPNVESGQASPSREF